MRGALLVGEQPYIQMLESVSVGSASRWGWPQSTTALGKILSVTEFYEVTGSRGDTYQPVSSSRQIQSQFKPAKSRYILGEYFPSIFIKGISVNSGFLGILKYDY